MDEIIEEVASDGQEEGNNEDLDEGVADSSAQDEKGADLDEEKLSRDPKALKYHITEKQEKYVKTFLGNGGNATAAVREAYGDIKQARSMGSQLRANIKVLRYIEDLAQSCAEIQYSMITNPKTPAAVRMDGIKNVLDRAGVNQPKEDDSASQNVFLGQVNITIDKG